MVRPSIHIREILESSGVPSDLRSSIALRHDPKSPHHGMGSVLRVLLWSVDIGGIPYRIGPRVLPTVAVAAVVP